jgi:hypothetical protein
VFGSEGAADLLQLATQAATPHQREVEHDFPVASFSLLLLLILAIAILETNGTAGLATRISILYPRSAGSDGHHIVNFGSARRSVKWHRPYSCSVNEPHRHKRRHGGAVLRTDAEHGCAMTTAATHASFTTLCWRSGTR